MTIEGGRERKTLVRSQFYFGRHNTVNNTPAWDRYVYVVDSVYKSGCSRVVEPGPNLESVPIPTSPSNKFNREETPPSIGFRHSIG